MHLRYDLTTAGTDCKENRHPQLVTQELGINYQYSTPQSLGNQWWFWNCTGVQEVLPKFLTKLELDPVQMF